MLEESAIPSSSAAVLPSSLIGGGAESGLADEAVGAPSSPASSSPTPDPSVDAILETISRFHPIEAARALGLSTTALFAILRRPDVQLELDSLRQLEADHAARRRQAAQFLAIDSLSEILNKRNDEDSNPIEVRRAASALSRLTSGRTPGLSPPWRTKPRVHGLVTSPPAPVNPDHDADEPPRAPNPNTITNETLSTLATGTVTRVLDKIAKLENPTPEVARSTLGRDVCQERDNDHWLTDLKRSRFFAYRKLPRTLDHPDLGWGLATVRVRYRGHEREPTLIRLINRGGPDPWVVHSFHPDTS